MLSVKYAPPQLLVLNDKATTGQQEVRGNVRLLENRERKG